MEAAVIGLFAASLCVCLILDIPVLAALGFGLVLFIGFGLVRGHGLAELLHMALSGIKTVRNILLVFVLIGVLTALWRSSGTIPYIVYHAVGVCSPQWMLLMSFLLCSLISFLTGTSFGTAATMGVICMTMAGSMGLSPVYAGGAVLAGCYFGDRASPMSTSAMLVATLTETDLYGNLKRMFRTAVVPFLLAAVLYLLAGLGGEGSFDVTALRELFDRQFTLHPLLLLPAAVIILFSLFRINVKITMAVSILCAGLLTVLLQDVTPAELARIAVWGYAPADPQAAALLSGGGILSMANVFGIVCISSCYAGLWTGTGLLDGVQGVLRRLSDRISVYGTVLVTALVTAAIACNQTLSIMLTHQLCRPLEPDREELALHIENTAVILAALIPWSIACSVTLSAANAPLGSIGTAFYLHLLVLYNGGIHLWRFIRDKKKADR